MGWFSRKKKEKEVKKKQPEKKSEKKQLMECPVCGQQTFEQVTAYIYTEKHTTDNDIPIIAIKEQECKEQTGEQTGFCESCGGIVHGWVFADPENAVSSFNIKDLNRMFFHLKSKMAAAQKAKQDILAVIPEVIAEAKNQLKNSDREFVAGYYLIIMLIENKYINLHPDFIKAYEGFKKSREIGVNADLLVKAMLVKSGSMFETHQKVKEMFQKYSPQYF